MMCTFIALYPLMKGNSLKGSSMQGRMELISLPVLDLCAQVCSPSATIKIKIKYCIG